MYVIIHISAIHENDKLTHFCFQWFDEILALLKQYCYTTFCYKIKKKRFKAFLIIYLYIDIYVSNLTFVIV